MKVIIILTLSEVICFGDFSLSKPGKCGQDNADRIYPGNITGITSYPWSANLIFRKNNTTFDIFHCGGSLISDRHVLTAAHCFYETIGENCKLHRIRLGEWNLETEMDCDHLDYCNEPVSESGYDEIIIHEKYDKLTLSNDIAIIVLAKSIDFTQAISPVCLPLDEESNNIKIDGARFTVVGWRHTRHRNGSYEEASAIKLHDWLLTGVDHESCNKTIRGFVSSTQLCAIGENTCRGDSGSALVSKVNGFYYAYGIVSYGCGRNDVPAVYTKVSTYLNWIERNIAT